MFTALVTADMNIRLYLKLIGANGIEMDIPFVFDTGFSEYLSLPRHFLDALGFPEYGIDTITMADGSRIDVSLHTGRVVWNGQEQVISIHCLEGDVLVGLSQATDYIVTLPIRINSTVTFARMP